MSYFTPPPVLEQLMQKGKCVAFVGAGFSRVCGMPDWSGLIGRLLDFGARWLDDEGLSLARAAFSSGDLPMASSLLKEALGPALTNECLHEIFGAAAFNRCPEDDRKTIRRRMSDLVRSSWAGIITTNYDELIEQAFDYSALGTEWVNVVKIHGDKIRLPEALAAQGQGKLFFVKLHGSLSGPNVVLTTEEYDESYLRTPQIGAFLQAVMLQYHVIFIGCSLEDEVLRIRRRLTGDFDGHNPPAFALLPGDPREPANQARTRYLKKQTNTEVIWFRKDNSFQGFDEFLHYLAGLPKPPEDIRALLRFQRHEDRLKRLSPRNERLWHHIAGLPDQSATVNELLSQLDADPSLKGRLCTNSLEDEMKYRLLYLTEVGLVTESVEEEFRYRVPPSARKAPPSSS